MKLSTKTRATTVSVALAGTLALSACGAANEGGGTAEAGSNDSAQLSGDLVGAGASSQQAAMEAWQAGFQGEYPDVDFSYDPVGSGGGREQFIAGATDFAGSDAALDDEELAAASGALRRRRESSSCPTTSRRSRSSSTSTASTS